MDGNKYRKRWWIPFTVVLFFCVAFCSFVAWYCVSTFNGSVIKNEDAYKLEIKAMTGTDLYTMELKEGDVLQIQFETEKGSMYMEIKAPDGSSIYRGNGKATKGFSLEIQKEGVYTIAVEARRAKGNICVDLQKVTESDVDAAMTVTVEELIGPWHLAEGENDDTVVNETFPGAMEFGNSMEITSAGNISWYIGADGGSGSYLLNGNILTADMISDIDGTAITMEFTVREKNGQLLLIMDYKNMTLCWSWGETETGKGE